MGLAERLADSPERWQLLEDTLSFTRKSEKAFEPFYGGSFGTEG